MKMIKSIYNINDYGAVADGKTLNSDVFAAVIRECSQAGGGTIYIPAGIFLTGPIQLTSNITIYLEAGARVKFVQNIEHYNVIIDRWEGLEQEVYAPMINGQGLENITIIGRGILDGQGEYWWNLFNKKELKYHRPRFIGFLNCNNVLIEGIKLINSPSWTINPINCRNVVVNKVTIENPAISPNTDGINPSSCKNVHISDCHIDVGDDCIAIKSGTEQCNNLIPCENITISNCTIVHGHGGVVIGSEMSGDIRNVVISNCVFEGTDRGIRIKSRRGRGGVVEDIRVNNIVMKRVICPFIINLYYYCGEGGKDKIVWDKNEYPVNEGTPVIRRIHFSNITARGIIATAAFIYGLPEMPVEDITFDNVSVNLAEDSAFAIPAMISHLKPINHQGFYCNNFRNIKFNNVKIGGYEGPAFEMIKGKNIEFTGCEVENCGNSNPVIVLEEIDQAYIFSNKQSKQNDNFLYLRGSGNKGIDFG